MKEEKQKYYNDKITGSGSSKDLFHICNGLLGKSKEQILSSKIPIQEIPEVINTFFIEKIKKIRWNLEKSCSKPEHFEYTTDSFSCFTPVSEDVVKQVILKSPRKFCELDPLPVNIFLDSLDVTLPYITKMINVSLLSGIVPSYFKQAFVKPLLKKNIRSQRA